MGRAYYKWHGSTNSKKLLSRPPPRPKLARGVGCQMSYKQQLTKEERSLRQKKRRGWTPLRTPCSELPCYDLFDDPHLSKWRSRPKIVRMHVQCGKRCPEDPDPM